jgi:hypothetical protein
VTVGTIAYDPGYSADGTGETIAVQGDITDAVRAYMLTVAPGSEVVLSHIAGIISTWPGVHDATGVLLNGTAFNVAVPLSPPGAPFLNTLTL